LEDLLSHYKWQPNRGLYEPQDCRKKVPYGGSDPDENITCCHENSGLKL
jgi:hypothetical protein